MLDANVAKGALIVCLSLMFLAVLAWLFMGCGGGINDSIVPPCDDNLPAYETPDCGCAPANFPPCPPKRRCLFTSDGKTIVLPQ
jgi:hypothetical protein